MSESHYYDWEISHCVLISYFYPFFSPCTIDWFHMLDSVNSDAMIICQCWHLIHKQVLIPLTKSTEVELLCLILDLCYFIYFNLHTILQNVHIHVYSSHKQIWLFFWNHIIFVLSRIYRIFLKKKCMVNYFFKHILFKWLFFSAHFMSLFKYQLSASIWLHFWSLCCIPLISIFLSQCNIILVQLALH